MPTKAQAIADELEAAAIAESNAQIVGLVPHADYGDTPQGKADLERQKRLSSIGTHDLTRIGALQAATTFLINPWREGSPDLEFEDVIELAEKFEAWLRS